MSTIQGIAKNTAVLLVAQAAAAGVNIAAEIVNFVRHKMSRPRS